MSTIAAAVRAIPLLCLLSFGLNGCGPRNTSAPVTMDINGGFERISQAGVPEGWSTSCEWGGRVMVTSGAAATGEQGLRMYGGCTVTSSVIPAPASFTSAHLGLLATAATERAASASLQWLDSSGSVVASDDVLVQGAPTRAFVNYNASAKRPSGARSIRVVISTPETSGATVDVDSITVRLDVNTTVLDCNGEPCLDGSGYGDVEQGADCGTQSNCNPDPDDPSATGTVAVTLVNSLPVQATFYADGGGPNATTTYHVTRWTPAGGSATITNAMTGPIGASLIMTTLLSAEMYPNYTHGCSVVPTTAFTSCTIRADRNADGFAILSCSCVAQ